MRPKLILQTHIWINHKKKDPFHQALYTRIDEEWCSSQAAKKNILEHLPIPHQKVKIVNYGRPVDAMENLFLKRPDARALMHLPSDATIFCSVSRLEPSKGIYELVLAAQPLLETEPHFHLAIIGGPSPNDATAKTYAENLEKWHSSLPSEIRGRVHFLGAVKDSFKYLKAFDVYVLPSYQETFSLALLDAQLAGLPVVGSRSGGTPDVVIENQTGWLFEPRSLEDLRSKLIIAYKDSSQWQNWGTAARDRVRRDFNTKLIFEQIPSFYAQPTIK